MRDDSISIVIFVAAGPISGCNTASEEMPKSSWFVLRSSLTLQTSVSFLGDIVRRRNDHLPWPDMSRPKEIATGHHVPRGQKKSFSFRIDTNWDNEIHYCLYSLKYCTYMCILNHILSIVKAKTVLLCFILIRIIGWITFSFYVENYLCMLLGSKRGSHMVECPVNGI